MADVRASGLRGSSQPSALPAPSRLPAGRQAAADPNKVVHAYFPTGETGFDPVRISDLYSATVNEAIFERLLTYDYLARPAKLVPMVAEAMPEVTDNGKTYTFRIRKGIYFTPDPAFKGQKRELIAQDFVYSFMRFIDPKNRSPYAFLLEGKIVGLDELAAKAKKTGKFDYDAKIPGIEAVDRYTLRFRLTETDYNFPYIVAHISLGAVAREVIEAYGDDTMAHPVGTGPYMLKSWTRALEDRARGESRLSRLRLGLRRIGAGVGRRARSRTMNGKKMPQIGRVEISDHRGGAVALARLPAEGARLHQPAGDLRAQALDGDHAASRSSAKQGIALYRVVDPEITYTCFNFRDPVVGGFTKEKIALRRAMIMAYDVDEEIKRHPQGPGGATARCRSRRASSATTRTTAAINQYDPELANKLLDYFGYKKGADGWRTLPDGKPLRHALATEPGSIERELDELWQQVDGRDRHPHGVRRRASSPTTSRRRRRASCRCGARRWIADYPGRRQLHAAPLRAEHRPEQQRLLRVEGVRRVLREVAAAARLAGAQPAVPRDDAADGSRRRVEPARLARAQRADPAVGAGLQEAPDPAGRVHVPGHRPPRQ